MTISYHADSPGVNITSLKKRGFRKSFMFTKAVLFPRLDQESGRFVDK